MVAARKPSRGARRLSGAVVDSSVGAMTNRWAASTSSKGRDHRSSSSSAVGRQAVGVDPPRAFRQLGVVGADVAVAEEADLEAKGAVRRRELRGPAGRHHPAGAPTLTVGQRGVRQVDQDRERAVVGAGPEDPPDQLDQLVGRQTIHCESPRLMLTRTMFSCVQGLSQRSGESTSPSRPATAGSLKGSSWSCIALRCWPQAVSEDARSASVSRREGRGRGRLNPVSPAVLCPHASSR